uniref:Uncharacterized protein n=1 Tax=Panagrolaimus davidi TaxID=227884 RepID=A0A914Q8C0_9BILA
MDNIERELSEVKERLNQAKSIFNAAESPEAQEEARTRMTELYVAKQMLAKTFSQQSIIRPKLMFLIIYGTPFVRIGNDLEANENVIENSSAAPLISIQQHSTSAQPSSSGTTNQTFVEEENHGSTVALCEKRKDSDNSDTAVF